MPSPDSLPCPSCGDPACAAFDCERDEMPTLDPYLAELDPTLSDGVENEKEFQP